MFVNLDTGTYRRYTGMQPAPDFVTVSPSGKYFAFASSAGWRLTEHTRRQLSGTRKSRQFTGSDLNSAEVDTRLASAFVGTTLYSIWEVDSLRPVWEMRYPDRGTDSDVELFGAPWENSLKLPAPWWAIDDEPELNNYPAMAFSHDDRYFVTSSERYGVVILDLVNGRQSHVRQAFSPKLFVIRDSEHIEVFLSNGNSSRIRLIDGAVETSSATIFESFPTEENSGEVWPLFQTDSTARWIGSLSKNGLTLSRLDGSLGTVGPISLVSGSLPMGVTRFELSKSARWAGLGIRSVHESLSSHRYHDTGFIDRFERIDLQNGRVVERIINMERESARLFDDGVPTMNVGANGYVSSFGACLSLDGNEILYAIPYSVQ